MRSRSGYPIPLITVVTLILIATMAAAPVATSAPIDVAVTPGSAAVHISGTAAAGIAQLQAVVYATFAAELPIVLIRRTTLSTDAAGRFEATIPIAPAYFDGTLITVIVQTTTGVLVGRGSIKLADPGGTMPVPG
jgi:hypothetical protein